MLHNEDFFPAPKQEENYWKPKSKRNLQKQQSGKENTVFREVARTGSPALATMGIQEVRTPHSLGRFHLEVILKMKTRGVVTFVQKSPQLSHCLPATHLSSTRLLLPTVTRGSSYIDSGFKIGQFDIDPLCSLTPSPFWKLSCASNFLSICLFQEPGKPARVCPIWSFFICLILHDFAIFERCERDLIWYSFNVSSSQYRDRELTGRSCLYCSAISRREHSLVLVTAPPTLVKNTQNDLHCACSSAHPSISAAVWAHSPRKRTPNKSLVFAYFFLIFVICLHSQNFISRFLSLVFPSHVPTLFK